MEAKRIDLAEWEYFGEGGSSTSYVNKMDGNIVVKLNNKDVPASSTEKEFLASKAFNEAGFPSPVIGEFVTDGERFGYTSRRIKCKTSFARILSQDPGSVDKLAGRFASLALELHRTPADISKMDDARQNLTKVIGDLSFVPKDVAESVRECLSSISDDRVCLHGDMNPSNLICFEDKDYWIGINEYAYGDPYLDIATMHVICHYLPSKSVKDLYHAGRRTLKKFFTAFKKSYFGENWNSKETILRIRNAAIVKLCAAAATKPEYSRILVHAVRMRRLGL